MRKFVLNNLITYELHNYCSCHQTTGYLGKNHINQPLVTLDFEICPDNGSLNVN